MVHRDVTAGCYDGHECIPSLTAGEKREAAALLKRAISTTGAAEEGGQGGQLPPQI